MPMIETGPLALLLWAALGYLLGSVSGGMILARAMNLGDLRKIGSGNIGATNVLRTGNKKAAALTLLFDAIKGALAALLAYTFAGEGAAQLAGFMALVGHCFPVWLGFKGGKGVATYLGVIFAVAWPVGLVACAVWAMVARTTKISSLSALVAVSVVPFVMLATGYGGALVLALALAAMVFYRHTDNIARLRSGTEPKIGAKR